MLALRRVCAILFLHFACNCILDDDAEDDWYNDPKSRRVHLSGMPRILMWIGRSLLLLSAALLVTMPVTQHLWTWDRFLHGGQDFELSALMVLSIFCLVLVLTKDSRQSIDSLFARWRLLEFQRADDVSAGIPSQGALSTFRIESVAGPPSSIYSIPLQI